ncbi:HNH endonuclease [Symbiopectobacterium purcellii]|uniref:HNH endonuclease n=1 Tax=Symbiopectobacterium purcellii TaxID=2871826 RepID=UPI003F8434C2
MTESNNDSGLSHAHSICEVENCGVPVRSRNSRYCEKHYMRVRRHGSTEKQSTRKEGKLEHSGGYLLVYAPNHPLACGTSRVYEHRLVYYDKHGAGPFRCHWCCKSVNWDTLHIDHLDNCKTNNELTNLVASCPVCNQKRGRAKMRQTMRKKSHRRYNVHGKTMCLNEWADYLGISPNSIEYRLNAGWDINKAFSPRIGNSGPPSRKLAKIVHEAIK